MNEYNVNHELEQIKRNCELIHQMTEFKERLTPEEIESIWCISGAAMYKSQMLVTYFE